MEYIYTLISEVSENFHLHTTHNNCAKMCKLSARRHYITIYDKSLFKWLRKKMFMNLSKKKLNRRKKLLKNTHTFPYSLDVYPWGSYNPHNPGKWKFLHERRLRHFSFIMKNYLMSSTKKATKMKKEKNYKEKIINDIRKQQRA